MILNFSIKANTSAQEIFLHLFFTSCTVPIMLEEKANKKSPEWLNASEKLNDLNFQFPILASTFDVSQSANDVRTF